MEIILNTDLNILIYVDIFSSLQYSNEANALNVVLYPTFGRNSLKISTTSGVLNKVAFGMIPIPLVRLTEEYVKKT